MGKNDNKKLQTAKNKKDDEFYTFRDDIDKELKNYKDELQGKIIYMPCDDYKWSEFPKYLKDKFNFYGLKKIIATNYDLGDGAWKYEYDGKTETTEKLQGDGDYRSKECQDLRDSCDVIITNPPFSKFRDFYDWLKGKDFLIIETILAGTYKNVFPDIKRQKTKIGYTGRGGIDFKRKNGEIMKLNNSAWITSFNVKKDPLVLKETYSPDKYPKYDNYDAINVDKTSDIPKDYTGEMGVPITFLYKFCPDQFEIIALCQDTINGKKKICKGDYKEKIDDLISLYNDN